MIALRRFRYLFPIAVVLGLAMASVLQGKGHPCDLLIQSTSDVYGELAPCG